MAPSARAERKKKQTDVTVAVRSTVADARG
jgi:hypothetical protein